MLQQLLSDHSSAPALITPDQLGLGGRGLSFLTDFLNDRRSEVEQALDTRGGVLCRGFVINDGQDFATVVRTYTDDSRRYTEGQSERALVVDKDATFVYTSTRFPQDQHVALHNELSYTAEPPGRIFFYCDVEPADGGETPVLNCADLYARLDPEVVTLFEQRKVRYVKNMHGGKGLGRSWQATFETEDKDAVTEYLEASGTEYAWGANNSLMTGQVREASIHRRTGEKLWFNQADLWHYTNHGDLGQQLLSMLGPDSLPTNAVFGDGSTIDPEALDHIRQTRRRLACAFPWNKGDVLLLDNFKMAHGRNPFQGPRRILVSLA